MDRARGCGVWWPFSRSAGAATFAVSEPGDIHDTALLDGEYTGYNFGASPYLETGYMGGIYAEHRAVTLVRFDLGRLGCEKVRRATLRLYKPKCFVQTQPVQLSLYPITLRNGTWTEGTGNCALDDSGVCWARVNIDQPWIGKPGCAVPRIDFLAKPLARAVVPLELGGWLEFNLPRDLVQSWLDSGSTNAGLLIRAEGNLTNWGQHVYFHSSEHYAGNGPQLLIEGEPKTGDAAGVVSSPAESSVGAVVPEPAKAGTPNTPRIKTPLVLPAAGLAFQQWLNSNARLARMTRECRMTPEQALRFYYFDTQVREEQILERYQRPLGRHFTQMENYLAQHDEAGVTRKLNDVRQALLTWEYIRETSWYTSGPNADWLEPWQLAQLFSETIFGRLEERNDEAGRARASQEGGGEWSGTWQPASGERLQRIIQSTLELTSRKIGLNAEQTRQIAGQIAAFETQENREVGQFREWLDKSRDWTKTNRNDQAMLEAVRKLHLHHERFLYYQSIYDTPRWQLFMEQTPRLGFARWAAEVGKRYAPKPRTSKADKGAGGHKRPQAIILPDAVKRTEVPVLLSSLVSNFKTNQATFTGLRDTGLTSQDYLRIINSQVAVFRKCQDTNGAIIDPVMQIEWQYSTPCYALSVALLHRSAYNLDVGLLESGLKAMDLSVDQMHEYRCAHNHGEFYLQPVMLALDLFAPLAAPERVGNWRQKLATIDPYRLHPDNLHRKKTVYNHNVVALAGEWLREKSGLAYPTNFFARHMENQRQYLTELGMYKDPNVPIVYDEFSRQFLASVLVEGYLGSDRDFYAERLWRGAWCSLFMQSPHGECPTGGRSAQHIWNEAQTAVTYEIYAAQYAREGAQSAWAAGAFKRAAHLSLKSIERWLRPDGSGYVVKNRYPIEARHGYERYSAQSQYNLLACWLLAVAYLYADDAIPEQPAPADTGGFVFPLVSDFHKVFANAAGSYVEYETSGDLRYNPTGLIRVHLRNSNPQLGPSDGVVHRFDPKTKADLGGENLAVGPGWRDPAGQWHRLADQTNTTPEVMVLAESPKQTTFSVRFMGLPGCGNLTQTITLNSSGVRIEDALEGVQDFRVFYPMLVFDGVQHTSVEVTGNGATFAARDGRIRFEASSPGKPKLHRTGIRLPFRNGEAETLFFDTPGNQASYLIAP